MFKRMITLLTVVAMIFTLGIAVSAEEPITITIEAEKFASCGTATLAVTSGVPKVTEAEWKASPTKDALPNNPGNWAAYTVTVPESGAYKVTVNAGVPGTAPRISVFDNEKGFGALCQGDLASTGSWTTYQDNEIGTIYLEKGEQYLRFYNSAARGGQGTYLNKFVLTRDEASDATVSKKRRVNAEYYVASYASNKETIGYNVPLETEKTNNLISGYVAGFNRTNWLEYDVYVAETGVYSIGMNAGVADAEDKTVSYTISANGDSITSKHLGAGGFFNYKDYDLGIVKLNEGKNTIRVTNDNASSYFQELTYEKADAKAYVDFENFNEKSDNVTVAPNAITIGEGGYITADVNFALTGIYTLAVDADVNFEINGGKYKAGDKFIAVAGTSEIKISADSDVQFASAYVKILEFVEKYEVESFVDSYDDSDKAPFKATSTISFNTGDWVEYKIDAPSDGIYELKAYGMTTTSKGSLRVLKMIEGDAFIVASGELNVFSKWTSSLNTVGRFALDKGENTIRIYNGGVSFVFDYFYLGKVAEKDESAESTDIFFDAKLYTDAFDKSGGNDFITSSYVSFNVGDWLTYNVYASKTGSYTLKTYGATLSDTTLLEISSGVNESSFNTKTGTPQKSGTSWSNFEYVWSELTTINLKEGKNVVKFYNPSGGYLFTSFSLTYAGEAVYNTELELKVEDAVSSYDVSASKPLAPSAYGDDKYVSFGKNDYINYVVYADVAGVYDVTAYHALGGTSQPALTILNDNGSVCIGKLPNTTGFYDFTPSSVGQIVLEEGKNEIKVLSTGAQFHFVKCVVNYVSAKKDVDVAIEAENYDLGMEGMGYHDNTYDVDDGDDYIWYGDDVERVLAGNGFAIDMEAEEWLAYTLNIEETGYYNFDALVKGDSTKRVASIYVDENKTSYDITPALADSYADVNVGDIYLEAGEHTIKFELTSGANLLVDSFKLYKADIALTEGDDFAKLEGNLNGLFGGKEIMCTLAVYEGNRLLAVDTVTSICGVLTEELDLAVNNIVKQDGIDYKVKAFIWNNMQGIVIE